ncbi:MAG: nitrate reductase, partial [Betaproteobacteria bacterium RIFCSPLOWO2_02_FULL_62_17]
MLMRTIDAPRRDRLLRKSASQSWLNRWELIFLPENSARPIGMVIANVQHMKETRSTCCYCGVGCGVVIQSEGDRVVGVRGDPDHPANFGRLCSKGATLHLSASPGGRARFPSLRETRAEPRHRVGWDEALDHVAKRFADIISKHGPDSVAFYISGQLLTEDYYVFNKLAKGLIGTNNVDTNSRLCMSSAVAGYKQTLGADAPPACYEDLDLADTVVIAGSNMAYAHPVLFRRLEDARAARPQMKIIVVDPRRTDTAAFADLHLPILPGTDIALFNAMLHVLMWEGLIDSAFIREHTQGFDALKQAAREYSPAMAARICGLPEADIVKAAKWFGEAGAALSLYCQGLNQSSSGTHKNAALINLHLATRQIGKPGAGPFSLTGQPNAMGGREVGGMANLLSAHRDLADAAHRAEVAALWGVPDVPAKPGKTAVEMFQALARGEIKAIWIACTNPAQSMPDVNQVRAALEKAELVVLQEAFEDTDTAAYADVLLPASSWGEKRGTVTNSERRITRLAAAVAPPGEARHDWEICVDFARRLEKLLGKGGAASLFPYEGPEEIFNEHRETTRGRDLDITGISYAMLESQGPQQWPLREGESRGKARLYGDGVFPTANGRARFVVTPYQAVAETTSAQYPLALTTGRLRDQWHGMSRTGEVARLFNHAGEPLLAMHERDLERRGLAGGDLALVKTRRGEILVRVEASDAMRSGQAFMPMHWGSQFMRGAGVNVLTMPAIDPHSGQPELKHAAAQVSRAELPFRVVAMRRFSAGDGEAARQLTRELRPLLEKFDYATLVPSGREQVLVSLRGYAAAPVAGAILDRLDALLLLDRPEQTMRYVDARKGVEKAARIVDGRVESVCLSGETAAQDWLKNMMLAGATA